MTSVSDDNSIIKPKLNPRSLIHPLEPIDMIEFKSITLIRSILITLCYMHGVFMIN